MEVIIKKPKNIVRKCLHYSRAIYPTILMALNFLVAVQKNPTIDTTNHITQLLNYRTSHPEPVIEYRRSGMITHIYSDALYIL